MGLLGNLLSATVKVAVSPLAIATDVVSAMSCEEMDTTTSVLGSAIEDVAEACDDAKKWDLI